MTRLLYGLLFTAISASAVVPYYFVHGFHHILPDGLDHILFILGLFFLSRQFSVLLYQMTLFTLAHSLALGLSLYGFVSLPTSWVEVAIALSISFIAVENLLVKDRLRVWRPWMVFGFGLIHGLGFAHTFTDAPIPPEHFLPAIFSFNLGIEFGQLTVIALAYGVVALWWKREWYLNCIARPVCMALAATGVCLAVMRMV